MYFLHQELEPFEDSGSDALVGEESSQSEGSSGVESNEENDAVIKDEAVEIDREAKRAAKRVRPKRTSKHNLSTSKMDHMMLKNVKNKILNVICVFVDKVVKPQPTSRHWASDLTKAL